MPGEIRRRTDRIAKPKEAMRVMEERAAARHAEEQAAHAEKIQAREEKAPRSGKKPGGRPPAPPVAGPRPTDQYHFTDPDSRIMKAGTGRHFEQSYNAQAAVETESRLIVAQQLTAAPNDREQLRPTLEALSPVIQSVAAVLVDSGYYSAAAATAIERTPQTRAALQHTRIHAPLQRQRRGRRLADLESREEPPAPAADAPVPAVIGPPSYHR